MVGRPSPGTRKRGHAPSAPAKPCCPPSGGRYVRYFLFLRWMRVFFSSLRCFFFAIRLRRFLMTEPIRPPSLRHNGRRARHHSPAAGEAGHTPENVEVSVSANRSRSPLAYLLPRCRETDLASFGRRMPPPAPD